MNLLPGAECRDTAVEGVRFRVCRAGSGTATPALLLHGVPQTGAAWRTLLPDLSSDRVVVVPDLKGLGGSEVVGAYDVPTLVRELAALVLHEVDGPVDVVGHDWGGSLGIALAAARPDLVRRLVVVNGPYRHIDYVRAFHIPFFALPLAPEALFGLGGRGMVRRMIGYAWRSDPPLDRDLLEHYATAYADPARVAAMLGYYRAAVRPRLLSPLRSALGQGADGPRFGRPSPERTLVVWGAADPVLPLAVGEAVVRDLGSGTRFVSLPGVGHFPLEEAPDVAVPEITGFLRAG